MSRSSSVAEITTYVSGLITEASPLTFPDNASKDEQNFVLNRDGSRRRRLGIDFEDGYVEVSTSVTVSPGAEVAMRTFQWRNAGGNANKTLIVVQVGNELKIFDNDSIPLSAGLIYTKIFADIESGNEFSMAVVDGMLVVVNGSPSVHQFRYIDSAIEYASARILVRDMFGVSDYDGADNLRLGSGIVTRPTTLTDNHVYNLRNQTWAAPRKIMFQEDIRDPIKEFFDRNTYAKYPSNADVITYSLAADAGDGSDRLSERFNASGLQANPIGTFPAPKGYFIIDMLTRGGSRISEADKLQGQYDKLKYPITSLPEDYTPGGATVITEYAGRVWYAGFSGEVVGGDENSPNLSSYIAFSQLVEEPSDIVECFQEGDPTSKEEPDLVDTDGGFIRLEGAYGIVRMLSIGTALIIVATNGVWVIQGGSDYGFTATNYVASKVTNHGCGSSGSVVLANDSVFYWSNDGIYVLGKNQYGDWTADNITEKTIQTYYESIPSLDKKYAKAVYDSFENKVYWAYNNRVASTGAAKKLVFDIALGAFYPFNFDELPGAAKPRLVTGLNVPPFTLTTVQDDIVVNGAQVTVNTEDIFVERSIQQVSSRETVYLALIDTSPTVSFSFCQYVDDEFRDWRSVDEVGVDAYAYLLTGYTGGGDFQRSKQVPYITFHFMKTEDGFVLDGAGDFTPTHQSSCKVVSQWDWANSAASNKWGPEFQAYRFRRHYMPSGLGDTFDNGFQTVSSKNKLRGRGKVLSMLLKTEPYKDCYLLGWSIMMGLGNAV